MAEAMAAHPEWTQWWERADDLGDTNVTVNGVSPFMAVAVEASVEGMIGKAGDKHARRAYRQLRRDGLSHKEARNEIGRAFTSVLWEVGTGRVHDGKVRFREVLRRVEAGETAEDIFSVHETTEDDTDPVG